MLLNKNMYSQTTSQSFMSDLSDKLDKSDISRRKFLKYLTSCGVLCSTTSTYIKHSIPLFSNKAGDNNNVFAADLNLGRNKKNQVYENNSNSVKLREVAFYDKLKEKRVKCLICPKECQVGDQERGFCGNKENHNGVYYTLAYNEVCAANVDPIEKKPLFHFLPSTTAFSISTAGCNFDCKFCQNWDISQSRPEQTKNMPFTPIQLINAAKRTNSASIAYTYGEPVVFYEYMYDTAKLSKGKNIRNVMISNGYINKKPLKELCKILDAIKIDFKAYTDKFYKETCLGKLKPVLDSMVLIKSRGTWLELVYLVIPTLNDKTAEFQKMSKWIKANLGRDVPIHFTRFHPIYKLRNLPPTPKETLEKARDIALSAELNYVYVGNVPGHQGENTYCPECRNIVIQRFGFTVVDKKIDIKGHCAICNNKIPGVWS